MGQVNNQSGKKNPSFLSNSKTPIPRMMNPNTIPPSLLVELNFRAM
jgi:hypothetical protein